MRHCEAHQMRGVVLLLGATFCCGCNSKITEVSGDVSIAGQPIANGSIDFLPAEGHGRNDGVKIKDGHYAIRMQPGKYKVKIYGYFKVGERHASPDPSSPMTDELRQIVPEQYNDATTLIRDVVPGRQTMDFPLDEK